MPFIVYSWFLDRISHHEQVGVDSLFVSLRYLDSNISFLSIRIVQDYSFLLQLLE